MAKKISDNKASAAKQNPIRLGQRFTEWIEGSLSFRIKMMEPKNRRAVKPTLLEAGIADYFWRKKEIVKPIA